MGLIKAGSMKVYQSGAGSMKRGIFCTVPMHGKESSIAVWHSINAMIDAHLNESTEYCWMPDDDVVDAH